MKQKKLTDLISQHVHTTPPPSSHWPNTKGFNYISYLAARCVRTIKNGQLEGEMKPPSCRALNLRSTVFVYLSLPQHDKIIKPYDTMGVRKVSALPDYAWCMRMGNVMQVQHPFRFQGHWSMTKTLSIEKSCQKKIKLLTT